MTDDFLPRPSAATADRLAHDLGTEVVGLRASLQAALDEADRHTAAGHPGRAADVLQSQRVLLAAVHRRLEDRLADAAVEREAEHVLAGAAAATPPVAAASAARPAAVAAGSPRLGAPADQGMARLLVAAAAAALGALLLTVPGLTDGGIVVAGVDASERDADPADVATSQPAPSRTSRPGASPDALAGAGTTTPPVSSESVEATEGPDDPTLATGEPHEQASPPAATAQPSFLDAVEALLERDEQEREDAPDEDESEEAAEGDTTAPEDESADGGTDTDQDTTGGDADDADSGGASNVPLEGLGGGSSLGEDGR